MWWRWDPQFLRDLIHRRADGTLVQLVWDSIQGAHVRYGIESECCLPPLAELKRLTLEHGISVDDAQRMLSMLEEVEGTGGCYSNGGPTFIAAAFWRAPEEVLEHLLGLVPVDRKLEYDEAWELLLLEGYSREFLGRLSMRLSPMSDRMCVRINECRPDLVEELGLPTPKGEVY